ncbi:MAG: type II toxin-antitoxin system RelB/DinJ family antitoxin [Atopobiaceae bacterium]|nr:type II toxin-antitoxin system RelB/DinJ family antitoxin [Atopobiaceae bacterium]
MPMTVINARVDAEDARLARRVLEREGFNMSWAIRTIVEYIARTGTLPQLGTEGDALQVAQQTTDFFEALPFEEPPQNWGDVNIDRQLINEERQRRLG